jgi:hypothetical protein
MRITKGTLSSLIFICNSEVKVSRKGKRKTIAGEMGSSSISPSSTMISRPMSQEFLQNRSKSRPITSQSTLSGKLTSQSQFMKKHKYIRCNSTINVKAHCSIYKNPPLFGLGKKKTIYFDPKMK